MSLDAGCNGVSSYVPWSWHEFEEGTSTEDQIKGYLDAFFETDSDDTETIDTETGEVLATTVDITGILDVA